MGIVDLWLPAVASAGVTFVASAIIWTVLKWHNRDYHKTGDEEAVRTALRGNAPGYYLVPYCMDSGEFKQAGTRQKYEEGPQAYVTVIPNGVPKMAPKLIAAFVFFLFVGLLCAYFVSRTLAPDADYLAVFRVAGTTAFIAHGIAIIPESIWFGRPWSMTLKTLLDALIYGLLTGGVFGWLV